MVTNERYDASEVDVAKMAKETLAARLQYQQTRAANRSLRIAQRETIPAVVTIVGTPGPYERSRWLLNRRSQADAKDQA